MKRKEITEANRKAWNEVMPIHQKYRKIDLKKAFSNRGFVTFDSIEKSFLDKIELTGKKVAQLCCNNGQETLSLVNYGAESAAGFDISDLAIEEANELQKISGLNCKFIRTDVYDIDEEWFNQFDMIYITIGAIAWLPDIELFFKMVSHLLKKDGDLLIYDTHPFCYMLAHPDEDEYRKDYPKNAVHSYFRTEPWIGNTGIDYIGGTTYDACTSYDYSSTFSRNINAMIKAGIQIVELQEFDHDISNMFAHLEDDTAIPKCYLLHGRKK